MELLNTKTAALKWLYQDELHHLSSIDLLERDLVEIAYAGTNSLLLINSETMLIHCKDPAQWDELLTALLKRLDPDRWYILKAHEDWYLEELKDKTGFSEVSEVYNSIYPKDLALSSEVPPDVQIKPLTMADFSFVRKVYLTVDDDDYIRERIAEGMLGAWYKNELAGFMGTHSDSTMGLLEVLPQYRRLGIGKALEHEMMKKLRSQGRRTYGNIMKDNPMSYMIHEKMGALISQRPIYWLFRPDA
ncbi:MAG: GNAT family N-acetyltransferase [Clostridiaceae bacterium]